MKSWWPPVPNERFTYDYKTELGADMSCVHPARDQRGAGDAAPVEGSDGVSRQGRCDARRGVSAGHYRDVVDISIVGHSGESCLGVPCCEFVGDVFFPKLGEVEWRHREIIHFHQVRSIASSSTAQLE